MAARGSIAKSEVVKKIIDAFGDSYIGEFSGKHYIWANDGGQKVQIAIALTCPKTNVGDATSDRTSNVLDFENMSAADVGSATRRNVEITEDEKAHIQKLMAELNL